MAVLGVSCNIDAGELVVVVLRVTRSDHGDPGSEVVMDHTTDPGEDQAKKLSSIQADLETVLKKHGDATCAVVRARDRRPFQRGITNEDEARLELQGLVLGTIRRQIDRTVAMSGQQIGRTCKSDKAAVLAKAKAAFGDDHKEAGMAALAALALAEG